MPSESYGFPKRHRLTRPREFTRVLRAARYRRNCGPLRILALRNLEVPSTRLGLIIGKRAVRRATERNALKRIARETFRTMRHRLPTADVVVHLRGPTAPGEFRTRLEGEFAAMVEGGKIAR